MSDQRTKPARGVIDSLSNLIPKPGSKEAATLQPKRSGVFSWRPFASDPDAAGGRAPASSKGASGDDGRETRSRPFILWGVIGAAVIGAAIFVVTTINVAKTAREQTVAASVVDRPSNPSESVATPYAATPYRERTAEATAPELTPSPAAGRAQPRASVRPEEEDNSDWIQTLPRRQIAEYYPERALAKGVEGRVALRCTFSRRAYPDCAVLHERPDDWRFGQAAHRLSRRFRATNHAIKGRPFMVTVKFRLES